MPREIQIQQLPFDAVYFLMFDGWKDEMRSNRWHYAARWSRHLPVVLVQPNQVIPQRKLQIEPESRITNCRILSVKASTYKPDFLRNVMIQVGQVCADMGQHGYSRPLLWCYNPHLVGLFSGVPGVCRIYHATENYFDFEGLPDWFYDQLRVALKISNRVVAVSDGVANAIRERLPDVPVSVVTNGCDNKTYATEGPVDRELSSLRNNYLKVAIYAGNINARIDFELLLQLQQENPDVLFAFAGPVLDFSANQQSQQWQALFRAHNFCYLGIAEPERLAALYRAADIGIIPYKGERWLVENGFPLKTLEMSATGLPVVSTWMKPIVGLARGIKVMEGQEKFLDAFRETARHTLSVVDREELQEVCRRNDYDVKFNQILQIILDDVKGIIASTRLDCLMSELVPHQWTAMISREWQLPMIKRNRLIDVIKHAVVRLLYRLYVLLPLSLRSFIPSHFRLWVKQSLRL